MQAQKLSYYGRVKLNIVKLILLFLLPISLLGCDPTECAIGFLAGTEEESCNTEPEPIPPPPPLDNLDPQVGIDGNGNALFVWKKYSGLNYDITSRYYTPVNGWSARVTIGVNSCSQPKLAMGNDGAAMAVWSHADQRTIPRESPVLHFTPANGWRSVTITDALADCSDSHAMVTNNNGGAVVVLLKRNSVRAARYSAGTGWSSIESVVNTSRSIISADVERQLSMNMNGEIVFVWSEYDSTSRYTIWLNRYTPGSGWQAAELIHSNIPFSPSPQVAIDNTGNIIVVWEEGSAIIAKHYNVPAGWSANRVVRQSINIFGSPQLAMNAQGRAIAVWEERNDVWASQYESGLGWSIAQNIESADFNINNIKVAIDVNGNAIALWQSYATGVGYEIFTNYFSASTGWGSPLKMDSNTGGNQTDLRLAMSDNGRAIALWERDPLPSNDSKNEYWYSIFQPGIGWSARVQVTP